jgi:hypothetical protein
MRKNQLQARLAEALDRLEELAGHKRLPKATREPLTEFVEQVRKEMETSSSSDSGSREEIFRLARVTNPKTDRDVTLKVRSDGKLVPSDAKRLGLQAADEWDQVRAGSVTEAKEKIEDRGGHPLPPEEGREGGGGEGQRLRGAPESRSERRSPPDSRIPRARGFLVPPGGGGPRGGRKPGTGSLPSPGGRRIPIPRGSRREPWVFRPIFALMADRRPPRAIPCPP